MAQSYYDKGYNKGFSLGKTIRYYSEDYLMNIAHKFAINRVDPRPEVDWEPKYNHILKEYLRGLIDGIEERRLRRQYGVE